MANELITTSINSTASNSCSVCSSALNLLTVGIVVGGFIYAIKLGVNNIKFKKNGYEVELSKTIKENKCNVTNALKNKGKEEEND